MKSISLVWLSITTLFDPHTSSSILVTLGGWCRGHSVAASSWPRCDLVWPAHSILHPRDPWGLLQRSQHGRPPLGHAVTLFDLHMASSILVTLGLVQRSQRGCLPRPRCDFFFTFTWHPPFSVTHGAGAEVTVWPASFRPTWSNPTTSSCRWSTTTPGTTSRPSGTEKK